MWHLECPVCYFIKNNDTKRWTLITERSPDTLSAHRAFSLETIRLSDEEGDLKFMFWNILILIFVLRDRIILAFIFLAIIWYICTWTLYIDVFKFDYLLIYLIRDMSPPPTLYIQADNSAEDNKDFILMGFLASLVQ